MGLRRATRSPVVFWIVVAALAIVTGLVVSRALGGARAQAARFGSLRAAAVAIRAVDAGAVLTRTDVEVREVPRAFLPDGWISSASEADGRTVVVPIFPDQPVLGNHLAPTGLHGVAAMMPPGTRAIAVPTGTTTAPLRRGDLVDVLATFDRGQAGDGEPTFPVATAAPVVDVAEEAATVAVTPGAAERIAYAMANGVVNLTVMPGPDRRDPDR